MRLSEAIRLGSMLKPQAFNTVFDGNGTCAMGAAFDAIGIALQHGDSLDPAEVFPDSKVLEGLTECPVCPCACWCGAIAHLNDTHRWTREQIADWVETIEEKDTKPNESATNVAAVDPSGGDRESVAVATT